MATLVLQAAGAVVGGILGGPFGTVLGRAVGAVAGAAIDSSLLAGSQGNRIGPRLTSLAGVASTEGAGIARVYGRARIGGQMIWSTRFEESVNTTQSGRSGGKSTARTSSTTTYSYFANFAIGLCEGRIADVRRIWADGKEIDQTKYTIRIYRGDESQEPDALIVAKEGADAAPAYRGLAYVVFERMALADFGNRVPQLTFEVVRPIGGLCDMVRAVDLIPGATEFGYAATTLTQSSGLGVSSSENRHQLMRSSDWIASLDALQALCPNLTSVALVVSWFGDDLRAGECTIAPRVENSTKLVLGGNWSVAGLTRAEARVVSYVDGRPAYGGTPSDQTVIEAIRDLKARGLSVTFYPFVMMDIRSDNELPNPWTGIVPQPPFPWRGRITCDPAPGQEGSVDASGAAATQIGAFFGSPSPGESEWSFRRMILHYANLCVEASGVDAFLIGSELASLTRVRSSSGNYPGANALAQLAADAKSVLGSDVKVSYAADWTEYGAHVLNGGDEVRFPLDVVWGSAAVDFVGIDAYWPLSDWRDGTDHADAAIARSVHDRGYLQTRVASGEGYDWFYASDADRESQTRTLIADGAVGKPFVFRAKDLVGWWSNPHYERVAHAELGAATAWVAQSKPIWLVEVGCPAVDRGANAPNLFPDPKSSESKLPPFSRGFRDDLIHRRTLEAIIAHFDPDADTHVPGANPTSSIYGGRMVDPDRLHLWAWDARSFPAFPMLSDVWGDAANWQNGHWLTGRLEGVTLDSLIEALAEDVSALDGRALDGFVDGYVIERPMSPRSAIEPLGDLFGFDIEVRRGEVACAMRGGRGLRVLSDNDLVPFETGELVRRVRRQESELPAELAVSYWDSEADYRTATALSRRLEGLSKRQTQSDLSIAIHRAQAQRLADIALEDVWAGRNAATFAVRPGMLDIEIGDTVSFSNDATEQTYRVQRVVDGTAREIEARSFEASIYDLPAPVFPRLATTPPAIPGPPHVEILDLSIVRNDSPALQYIAATADPWPGALAVWRSWGSDAFEFWKTIDKRSVIGKTASPLGHGPVGRIDRSNVLTVEIASGALSSVDQISMLGGRNVAAVANDDGVWEILGFTDVEVIGPKTWRLNHLLRGLGGEDALAARTLPAGSRFVLLDDAVVPLSSDLSQIGATLRYRIGPADRDHADVSYVEISAGVGTKALTPYSPVQVRAQRNVSGVEISFFRRSRVNADNWELFEVPLGEDREQYEVAIVLPTGGVRRLTTLYPFVVYAAEVELADFGVPQTALDLTVCQMSALVGRGYPRAGVVPVL